LQARQLASDANTSIGTTLNHSINLSPSNKNLKRACYHVDRGLGVGPASDWPIQSPTVRTRATSKTDDRPTLDRCGTFSSGASGPAISLASRVLAVEQMAVHRAIVRPTLTRMSPTTINLISTFIFCTVLPVRARSAPF